MRRATSAILRCKWEAPRKLEVLITMSWKKSKFASSLMSIFGDSTPDVSRQSRLSGIRQAMLDCLAGVEESPDREHVWSRVLYASDVQSLWYLRGDVMSLLAGLIGESAAMVQISAITHMFKGLLPSAQKSRPNRLHK